MVGPIKRRNPKVAATEPVIDAEFQSRIPPLTEEEERLLEDSLATHGCLDTIKVWGGKIIDGHNRVRLCKKLDVKYKTEDIPLLDREAALDWIDRSQLGRRNLHPGTAALLRGRVYNRRKQKVGRPKRPQSEAITELKRAKTSVRLAEEFGVSKATVERDGSYAAAVDTLRPIAPELEAQVIKGEGPPRKRVIEAALAAQESPEKAKEILTTKPAPKPRSKPQPPTATPPPPPPPVTPPTPIRKPAPADPAYFDVPDEYKKYLGIDDTPVIDKLIEAAEPLLGKGYSAISRPDAPFEGNVLSCPADDMPETEFDSLCANLSTGFIDEKVTKAIVIFMIPSNAASPRLGLLYRLSSAVCLSPGEYVVFYIGSDPKAFSFAFLSHGIPLVSLRAYSRIEKGIRADAEAIARLALSRAGVTDKEKQDELLSAGNEA
jgi:hypothetical protein